MRGPDDLRRERIWNALSLPPTHPEHGWALAELRAESRRLRASRRALARWGVALFLLVALGAACICLTGCVSGRVRDSVATWRRDWGTYRRAVVPHPSYGPSGVAAVGSLEAALSEHLDAVVEACR